MKEYWKAVLQQDAESIRSFFHKDAVIRWHNTNEMFDVEEFLIANCEYPGDWDGNIVRTEVIKDLTITVANVFTVDRTLSFHVVSFIKSKDNKIVSIDEYWGDDGDAPQWRLDKHIGLPIK